MKKLAFILAALLTLSTNAYANTEDKLKVAEQKLTECTDDFDTENKNCPDIWNVKCHDILMDASKKAQKCYRQITVDLFENFYGMSRKEAEDKFDSYRKFIYEEHLFLFNNTTHCKNNNCGNSVYLYSEYSATHLLYLYTFKIIKSISSRIY